ncbi:MAG: ATP-binding protein [Lachnospiraceae bacterium]|jgi:predicted AAA+ superfamily ATPase|nr:ATP-binding protein [Lachnospiraceae bacterium]
MYLPRAIYQDLMKWKKSDSGKVLEVNGARQSGKTYILTKFAKENYEQFIYINMVQSSGRQFEECLNQVFSRWKPGAKREEKPIHQALLLYEHTFQDHRDTVVVIDEIQDSPRVFSMIREFAREFQAHFIVTGSYLGKTVNKEYFLPAGDVDVMMLDTMSYEEFLEAAGQAGRYREASLYGGSPRKEYQELKKWYEIYCHIGGYPAVVKKYLETFDRKACRDEIAGIVQIFVQESQRYFDDILEVNLLEQVLPSIAQMMIREKKGSWDLVKELSAVIFHHDTSRITKKSINQAIAWLYRSNVIGYCAQVNEGDVLNITPNRRFYFRDLGVAGYFLDIAGASPDTIAGIVNENFVYTVLRKKVENREIAGTTPWHALYKDGEMDFFVNSRADYCNYGIEVKAGRGTAKTADRMLRDGKIQYLYLLKGDTCGGIEDKKITVPVYLAGRIEFERGRENA